MTNKKVQKEFEETYFLLEQAFESGADGICIIDNDFNIIKVNDRLVTLLEVEKNKILGRKFCKLLSPSSCNLKKCPIKRIKNGENYITYEAQYILRNRKISLLITATPLFTNNKYIEGTILYFKDITSMAKYRQELNEAKHKAEESNKLKAQYLAHLSHEIRTPINGIIGVVELLEDLETTNIQKEYINILKFLSEKLLLVIDDILDLSKIESNKLQQLNNRFSLLEFLKDIANYFTLQANKEGLDFYYKVNNNIPNIIIGDSGKLSQILFNIIGNSIKFTEKGWISLEVNISYENVDSIGFKFIIKDTGIGIPMDKLKFVFEGFNQLGSLPERKYGGTGLGLTISKKLIELMGGEITVSSQEGNGSAFFFDLEFLKDKFESQDMEDFNLEKDIRNYDEFSKLNILVVEDDLINQKIVKMILEKNNWVVTIKSNGKETLEYLNEHSVDMVLMDIYMPGMNGFEVVRIIREEELTTGKHTPIIGLTAAAMKEDKEKCLEIGMDGYISKPIRSNTIYQTIIRVLKSQREIRDLNIEELLDRVDGDKDIVIEIIEDIISDEYEKEYIGKMEVYIEKEKMKDLSMQIHKFKGSMVNIGSYTIIKILQEMDNNINTKDLNTIKKLFEELKNEFSKTKDKLKIYK